jgi:hypothetical protein
MCTQKYIQYTCGCEKDAEFIQYAVRENTNFKCDQLPGEKLKDAAHMCKTHMVKAGTDELRR